MLEKESEKSDEEIAGYVQAGEFELFGVLVERYEKKMQRYARKFFSNQEEINDILQDIFLKAYKNIKGFDARRKFSSWLYRIAHNELVNQLKKKKRSKIFLLSDFDVLLPYSVSENTLDKEIDKKAVLETINKCLNKLNLKYKEPLVLYYSEGLTYREIADVLQIPISTAGIRLKRGKEAIKLIYKNLNQKNERKRK